MQQTIGFIGQGWIGKNYADDFERRGLSIVRYGLEPEYAANKSLIAECGIVFIAVPTPTTLEGFDLSIVRGVLPLVGVGKIAVIKSTMVPGSTEQLQKEFSDRIVMHSPEFLRESSAAKDASEPERNIIGIVDDTPEVRTAAESVLKVLPPAPFATIMSARAAELVKYAGNVFLALKVVYANMLYDLASSLEVSYEDVQKAVGADPRIGSSHLSPVSASGHTVVSGRGAGGHCFIKDLEAFRRLYATQTHDAKGIEALTAIVEKNNQLLVDSNKDLDLLKGVYGDAIEVAKVV